MKNLYNFIFNNDKKIKIIVDNKKKIWFVGNSIAKVLNYKAPVKAIQKFVPEKNKKEYGEIKVEEHKYTRDLQKNSTMIDEVGLFRLTLKSKQQVAIEFQNWLTDIVLPKLRETGQYELNDEMKTKIEVMLKKYDAIKKENSILIDKLENDPCKYRGALYIKEVDYDDNTYHKIGRYKNYKNRNSSYKTGQLKDPNMIFIRECDNIVLAEAIVKYKLRKCQYTPGVEIYTCKLSMIKK